MQPPAFWLPFVIKLSVLCLTELTRAPLALSVTRVWRAAGRFLAEMRATSVPLAFPPRYTGLACSRQLAVGEGAVLDIRSWDNGLLVYVTQRGGVHLWDTRMAAEAWRTQIPPKMGLPGRELRLKFEFRIVCTCGTCAWRWGRGGPRSRPRLACRVQTRFPEMFESLHFRLNF